MLEIIITTLLHIILCGFFPCFKDRIILFEDKFSPYTGSALGMGRNIFSPIWRDGSMSIVFDFSLYH